MLLIFDISCNGLGSSKSSSLLPQNFIELKEEHEDKNKTKKGIAKNLEVCFEIIELALVILF